MQASPKKSRESLEDLIECPMCGFANQIIVHTVHTSQCYKHHMAVIGLLDVMETIQIGTEMLFHC